jgi:hypothetical protein
MGERVAIVISIPSWQKFVNVLRDWRQIDFFHAVPSAVKKIVVTKEARLGPVQAFYSKQFCPKRTRCEENSHFT